MPLNNYLEQNEYGEANGVDTTTPLMNLRPGFARVANNCDLGLVSGWIKRKGYSKINGSNAWSTRIINAGTEFRTPAGVLRTVVFGKTSGGTSGNLGYVAAGDDEVTAISSGYADTVRPAFAQFRGRLFMYNGSDNGVLYDGTTTRQIGITAPTNAPIAVVGGGGSLSAGNYLYVYTYYNSTTKAESSPSPVSSTFNVAANDSLDFTLTAGSSTTADLIRIYRTVANGNQFFLEGTNAISDTSYSSTAADDELGRPLEEDNSRLADVTSDKGKYPVVAQSRVFLVTGRNEVRYSALGYDGPMPESFRVGAVVDTTGTYGDGDDIVGLGNIGDLVVVLKRRSHGILQPIDVPLQNSEVDTQFYRYVETSDSVGAVSHWAGAQVQGEYVFAGRDMIWATNGQQVRPIALPIQATLRSLGWASSQVANVSCGVDPKYSRIYIQAFADSDDTVPKYTLVGDYQQYPNFRWTLYTPGSNETTHPGVRAACFINVTNSADGSADVWFGNAAGNGFLYKMNDGDNDASLGIAYKLTTRPLDLGQPNHLKLYKTFRAEIKGNSGDYNITLSPSWDMSALQGTAVNVNLQSSGGLWDFAQWDVDYFSDDTSVQAKYTAHRKARFIQMTFTQDEADAPVTVFGWSPSGSLFQN